MFLGLVILVSDRKCFIENGQAFTNDLVVDVQRRDHVDTVEVGKHNEAKFPTLANDLGHCRRASAIWGEWFFGLTIGDVFDGPEATDPAHVTNGWMTFFEAFYTRSDDFTAEPSGVFDHAFFVHGFDCTNSRSRSQWMSRIGQ